VRTEHPPSAPIAHLSPTSYEILRECRLRFSYGQQPGDGRSRSSAATRLGTVCHNVLDIAVREGLLESENWRTAVEELWDAELSVEKERAVAAGVSDEPRKWRGYQLKRARLFQIAGRLRAFLDALPPGTQILTEEPLSAHDGLLFGRADLIIRNPDRHQIVDYKSGSVLDHETNLPREAYVRQLQLYAYLEHAASSSWPSSAHLFPLHGAPVEIEVDPQACSALAAEALAALRTYNEVVPAVQPAAPSPVHCQWCPAATICSPFWNACDETWAPNVRAAAGTVSRAFATELGGITIHVHPAAGSIGIEPLVIKNIDQRTFEQAREVAVGDEVAATGLIADEHGSGYWVSATGAFTATLDSARS